MRPTFMHLYENSLCSDALSKLLENPNVSGRREGGRGRKEREDRRKRRMEVEGGGSRERPTFICTI
jgi:hypothetical protein